MRTFENPVAIRFEKENDSYKLYWKLCNGAGGYKPGKLIIEGQKNLERENWDNLISLVNTSKFWELPTNEKSISGYDGSQWILEGVNSKYYHVVDRWTPRGGHFYNACDYLLSLTTLVINKDDKY